MVQLAGCIIKDQAGRILLLHRNTSKRAQWEIPGGKVELGETLEQAAIRELKEELGVRVKIRGLIGEKPFKEGFNEFVYTWFEAEILDGRLQIIEPDVHDDFRYFTFEAIQELGNTRSANVGNFILAL